MKHRVTIVSHADADGHIIAEQVRRNLALTNTFKTKVVVDPDRTRDHKSWLKLDTIREIDDAEFVFFVDLMFAPATFDQEAEALVRFVRDRPDKRFFLLDHHPLPLRRLGKAKNLRMAYRPDVFEVAIGPRSGMMVVAALCEKKFSEVADVKQPTDQALADGMRRAAALGGPLPGEKLMALLRADRWDVILEVGKEDQRFHRMPRGRRARAQLPSDALMVAEREADALIARGEVPNELQPGRTAMAYDADIGQERFSYETGRRIRHKDPARSKDLEAIVTLLEIAALSLTDAPGATFTLDELVAEARDMAGDEISLSDRDIKIVMEKANFVERLPGKRLRVK